MNSRAEMSIRAPTPVMRSLGFASVYVYSPGGSCTSSRRSRALRSALKSADARFLERFAARVLRTCEESASFGRFLAGGVLVPVPASTPGRGGADSVSECLARVLLGRGLGGAIWVGLRRVHAVRRSSVAKPRERPTVHEHYASMAVAAGEVPDGELILVDDVITKGRTLLAAASRLKEAHPGARIRAFALLRTLGLAPEVERLLEPCMGEIRWRAGDAHRRP